MANLFGSAISGMNAAQLGIATTEHNIANASTPGFSRQQTVTAARGGQQTGAGFVGAGVDVSSVKRIYDQFLNAQVLQEQNQASYLTTYSTAMRQIDNLVADPAAGASPAMQSFFDAMNGVANNPQSVTSRQTLLGSAQFAVNRFQAIDQRLTDIGNGNAAQITSSVGAINTYALQIATLNGNIKRAIGSSTGQPPNDLIDQRDQVISKLNLEVKTSSIQQPDGTVSVFVGNGQALVINEQSMNLQTVQSTADPSKIDIAYLNNGVSTPIQQSSLQGGNLGAYLNFRDQSLEPARNALGRVAMGLATSINQQNQLGQDLNGALGGNLFNVASPRVDRFASNNPASGLPTVTIASVAALTTSDYQLKSNGGTSYTLLRMSDNTATTYASLPQTVDGMTITAPAPVTAGDTFTIRPTANGARDLVLATNDPAKIAAAAPIRGTAALTNIGTGKISAGAVSAAFTAATVTPVVTLSYTSGTNMFTGFPATLPVSVTNNSVQPPTTIVYAAGASVPYTSGATMSFGGVSFELTGTPANGDTFTVSPNTNAVGDNRNALLMSSMQTQNVLANGTASLQGAYSQLVGQVGTKTNELAVTSLAQNNMVAQTVASQQSVSGVNLDEEAANLMQYQKAYQAAAKAMQIATTMFDAVLAIGR